MRGRDVILIFLVLVVVGALSAVGYWFGAVDVAETETSGVMGPASTRATDAESNAAQPAMSEAASGQERADAAAPRVALELDGEPPSAADAALEGANAAMETRQNADAPTEATISRDGPAIAEASEPGDVAAGASESGLSALMRDGGETEGGAVALAPDALNEQDAAAAQELLAGADGLETEPELSAGTAKDGSAPSFDLVRVEQDGLTHVAGRAAPGDMVAVLVDGLVAAETRADARGEFYVLIDPPPFGVQARRLDLEARSPQGDVVASLEPVIVTMPSRAGDTPLALKPTEEGVVVLGATNREPESRVSIDSVSYGESGEVVITGRGKPGESARIYLDNALSGETMVDPDGAWRVKLTTEIEPAVYTLRVDQLTAAGAISGRAETPFEREAVEDIVLKADTVVVQPGNNLWRIADYLYGDGTRYTVIYQRNRDQVRNPHLIYPGQVLNLPEDENAN